MRCTQCEGRLSALRSTTEAAEAALREIATIIERVDNRCMATDGPVTPTLREMTQAELSRIYELASSAAPHPEEP